MNRYFTFLAIWLLLFAQNSYAQTNQSIESQRRNQAEIRQRAIDSQIRNRDQQREAFDRSRAAQSRSFDRQSETLEQSRQQQIRSFDQSRDAQALVRDRQIVSTVNSLERQNDAIESQRQQQDNIRDNQTQSIQNSRERFNQSLANNRAIPIINNTTEGGNNFGNAPQGTGGNVRYIIKRNPGAAEEQQVPLSPEEIRARNAAAIQQTRDDLRDSTFQLREQVQENNRRNFTLVREQLEEQRQQLQNTKRATRNQY